MSLRGFLTMAIDSPISFIFKQFSQKFSVGKTLDPPLMVKFKDKVQWPLRQCTSLVAKHAKSLNQNSCNAFLYFYPGQNTTTVGIDCLAPVLSIHIYQVSPTYPSSPTPVSLLHPSQAGM